MISSADFSLQIFVKHDMEINRVACIFSLCHSGKFWSSNGEIYPESSLPAGEAEMRNRECNEASS